MAEYLPKARTYLTEPEVHKLMAAAARGSNGVRNACMILFMFRHGLRLNEALGLQPPQIDLEGHRIHIHRLKNGLSGPHLMGNDEILFLKKWLKEREKLLKKHDTTSDILFCKARGANIGSRITDSTFRQFFPVWGRIAGFSFHVHAHMLRHACGYSLANRGYDTRLIQDYLGHKSIMQTVKYTTLNPKRFFGLWDKPELA
jgi:type 1 fimbriae regulatory protein FimB